MESFGTAAVSSWALDPLVIALFLLTAGVYVRGWLCSRREVSHLACFLSGLVALWLALESPLDALDALFLSAHMTQHMLLMMIAPPLLLLGDPTVPVLRGLPRDFVKQGLGPFLTWPALRRIFAVITAPPVAWFAFAASTILWHLPKFYELALTRPLWHNVQHACFFWTGVLFWWPVLQPGRRSTWPRWSLIPYLLLGDILNTALSAFLIFSDRVLYPSYEAIRVSGLSAREDQAAAGAIMWVPGSIIYLVPAIVIAVRLFSGKRMVERHRPRARPHPDTPKHWPLRMFRRAAQTMMLLLAVAIMWDGFFGQQVAALNLAGVLPWIHWRAFSVLALLVVGNLFCLACPFTLARDIGRRFLPAGLRWPRGLRSKWLSIALFVVYLWAYEAYGLWDSPWLTAWIIAGYFSAALLIDGAFHGASFCKYVCPIGQFHFVSSLISPRQIGVRNLRVCQTCRTHDCIKGNARARGCELDLFQPKKTGNMDCTFCLDCVQACPHDNVALVSIAPAGALTSFGRLSKRTDVAVLAMAMVFGALVNAAFMVTPVMMWEHDWHQFPDMRFTIAVLVIAGVLIAPAVLLFGCATLNRLVAVSAPFADVVRRFAFALVPVGFAMWAAHLLYHLATTSSSIPGWLTPMQIILLDAGLLLTLYVCWRIALQSTIRTASAVALTAPWTAVSIAVYAAGIWILFQPMQMRGMLH